VSDPAPIARQDLLEASFTGPPAIERAHISRVELAPGQAAGLHRHPCHVIGYVISGTIRFQIAQQPATVLATGDAFHEPDGVWIERFDNASNYDAAVFLACYLLPPGEQRLIEMAPRAHSRPGRAADANPSSSHG
jgi:quercetin dioxygenase-like cupin family protein